MHIRKQRMLKDGIHRIQPSIYMCVCILYPVNEWLTNVCQWIDKVITFVLLMKIW